MLLEDLQTFVAVADAGGVSPAARRLGLAKSIVSRRLLRLEADLGVQLLARTTRGASLTEAGLAFREHAARITAEMECAREILQPSGDLQGLLRVAAPLSFAPQFAPILAEMARLHPRLHIHTAYSDRFVDLVAEGYDCAIRVGFMPDSNLIARRVGPIRPVVVASPGYIAAHGAPQTPADIAGHEVILQATESWKLTEGGRTVTIHPQGRFKADNGMAIAKAALAGLGIAALPDALIEEELESGALVRVLVDHPFSEAGIFVVRPPGQHPPRKVRVLIDLLVERFGQACQEVAAAKDQARNGEPRRR